VVIKKSEIEAFRATYINVSIHDQTSPAGRDNNWVASRVYKLFRHNPRNI